MTVYSKIAKSNWNGAEFIMRKKEDRNTRYFIDLDLRTRKILKWDYDQRDKLAGQELAKPFLHRIFITKGQYNKLEKKNSGLRKTTAKRT
jgi:hypothetical protein